MDTPNVGIARVRVDGASLLVKGYADDLIAELDAANEAQLRDDEIYEADRYNRVHKRLNP